jgi:hypothetical protein
MASANDLTRMVPGFDFLQKLMQGAGNSIPGVSQWIAPTLDPEELDKRIQELKTVQFWLEQNAKLLAATIQGLEVQRMTLSTLQSMNLPLAELRDALTIKPARTSAAPAPAPAPPPAPESEPEPEPAAAAPAPAAAAPAVDPMQWWGALTQQFTELASQAVKGAQAVAPAATAAAEPAASAAAKTPVRARRAAGSGIAAAAPRKRSR